jgi:hypothetical protein
MTSSPPLAGTITCNDQVDDARATYADRLDRAARETLDTAARLCRENRRAEALRLAQQVRDAVNRSGAPVDRGH